MIEDRWSLLVDQIFKLSKRMTPVRKGHTGYIFILRIFSSVILGIKEKVYELIIFKNTDTHTHMSTHIYKHMHIPYLYEDI
jgi:hypothetical protein